VPRGRHPISIKREWMQEKNRREEITQTSEEKIVLLEGKGRVMPF